MKKLTRLMVPVVTAMLIAALLIHASQSSKDEADQKILERQVVTNLDRVTTTSALTSVLDAAGVPGGIEVVTRCEEPIRHYLAPAGSSLRDMLESIVAADPQYRWQVEEGVVNLVYQKDNPAFLDQRVAKFEVAQRTVNGAVNQLLAIPEVQRREAELNLGSRLFRGGGIGYFDPSGNTVKKEDKTFSVSCENVTVREALNAIVRAHGRAMWVYKQGNCTGSSWYSIGLLFQ